MAVLTAMTEKEARNLLADYGLGDFRELTGIAAGSVNSNFMLGVGDEKVFCRVYEEQGMAGALREAGILEHLARAGVPTPAPLRRRDGNLVSVVRQKPAALFPWRDGEIFCQARVDENAAERVGEALAQLHVAGAALAADEGRFGFEALCQRLNVIRKSGREEFVRLVPALRESLTRTQEARDRNLPSGLIHGDLFRDNVLWDSTGTIAALLDFESACAGTYAYDLMVCILSWCVGDGLKPELARAMCRGYQKVRRLQEAEKRAMLAEGCFAALRFTITRITDYAMRTETSGPRVVKDWRRFRDRFESLRALGQADLRRTLDL